MLELYWRDINNEEYHIANLDKINNLYILDIVEENLIKATKRGCMGIGNIDLLKSHYESTTLFDFFSQRIPSKEKYNIDLILKEYGLTEYDDMKLLEITKGKSLTDRYYLKLKEV